MSKLIVELCIVNCVKTHPNADQLELIETKGWQLVVRKGAFAPGDWIVYVPIDSIIPPAVAERWGVAQYLDKGRVRCAKLRGEPSYGVAIEYVSERLEGFLPDSASTVIQCPDTPWPVDEETRLGGTRLQVGFTVFTEFGDNLDLLADYRAAGKFNGFHPYKPFNPKYDHNDVKIEDENRILNPHAQQIPTSLFRDWQIGDDVAHIYGITKYEPQVRRMGYGGRNGINPEAEPDHAGFPKYTDIQNCRHFPHAIEDSTEVVATEKIHGTNSRIGIVQGELMAGSHKLRRKKPADDETDMSTYGKSLYWLPWTIPGVKNLLENARLMGDTVVIYGEIYGPSIQNLGYGVSDGDFGYRVFDIKVNGRYADHDEMVAICEAHNIEMVPLLYRGPYNLEKIKALSGGTTTLTGDHIREGVVVKPVIETTHPKLGRVILKYVSDAYLFSKGITDSSDE